METEYEGNRGVVKFGQSFDVGFSIYRRGFAPLLGSCAIFIAIYFVVSLFLSLLGVLGDVLSLVTGLWLFPVLMGGVFKAALSIHDTGRASIADVFSMFERSGSFVVFSLIQLVFGFFVFFVIGVAGFLSIFTEFATFAENGTEPNWTYFFILMAVLFVVGIAYWAFMMWGPLAIVDRNRGGWDAIKVSAALTKNQFFASLGLLVFASILGMIGLIALLIGVFFTAPLYFAILAAGYRSACPQDQGVTEVFD